MESTKKTVAAMTAAHVTCPAVRTTSTTLHADIRGRVQGIGLSAAGAAGYVGVDAPAMGFVDPRLEEPPA